LNLIAKRKADSPPRYWAEFSFSAWRWHHRPPAWGPVVAEAALEPEQAVAAAARVQALGAAERAQAVEEEGEREGAARQFILWTNPV
jgi:hypothetical protein